MPRNVGILCLGLIGMILSGCGGLDDSKDHEIKNVLIMLVDTLRADHLGAYGYDRATSPNIDLLAAESVQFERAFSVSPWTRTSVVSMFTSMYPVAHGCQDKEDVASPQLTMMAEVFKANGFKTIGFSSNIGVSEDFNVVQGFDDFTYFRREPWFESHPSRTDLGYVPIEGMIPAAINALDEIGDSPFFLYFHSLDPHWLYEPPEQFALWGKKEYVDLYDGEIRHTDHYLQQLLDHLEKSGKLDETLVIFTSDHGEEFGDHGGLSHGHTLYNELLHVPLLIRHPHFAQAKRMETVRLIDIFPTLIEVFDLDADSAVIQGRSLLPLLLNQKDPDPEQQFVFAEVMYPSKIEGVSLESDGWKLIWTKQSPSTLMKRWNGEISETWAQREKTNFWELYNTEQDPSEQRNLAFIRKDVTQRVREEMKKIRRDVAVRLPADDPTAPAELNAEALEALRALGYVE